MIDCRVNGYMTSISCDTMPLMARHFGQHPILWDGPSVALRCTPHLIDCGRDGSTMLRNLCSEDVFRPMRLASPCQEPFAQPFLVVEALAGLVPERPGRHYGPYQDGSSRTSIPV
jgi:hypothetical protein